MLLTNRPNICSYAILTVFPWEALHEHQFNFKNFDLFVNYHVKTKKFENLLENVLKGGLLLYNDWKKLKICLGVILYMNY
jgi:hypothetical protein